MTRLVLKHRILIFRLDFRLDLLQMTVNFMLLQNSCIRHIQVRWKVIILNITDNKKKSGLYDFIHGPCEKLETSDKQNNALRWPIRVHTQLYYRITSSLASITFKHRLGHRASGSQILSRGSIKYTRFTLYYSWYAMI